MAKFVATIKAIITRLVFASHGFIAIWQVTTFKRNPLYWYLSCPILLLFFEGIFTVTIKANQEWKWFCPSVFLYLSSVVPAIWLLELDKLEKRTMARRGGPSLNATDTFHLTSLDDLRNLEKAFGVNFRLPEIEISTETWVTLIEQFLMLILIIGRWMLPKGDLTRDQLSQLLLVYIGTAADIIEFFDSFKDEKIAGEGVLVYLTLGIWSWSLMQFSVVLTATKSRKSRLTTSGATWRTKAPRDATSGSCCCGIDVWAIALNMILQDGPFLAFRLILITHYRIVSYTNIFFTCKNTLVILLQLYRLYVVQSEKRHRIARRRAKIRDFYERMPTISVISRGDLHKDTRDKRFLRDTTPRRSEKRQRRRGLEITKRSGDFVDSSDVQDFDRRSSPEYPEKVMRRARREAEYSTSSSRNSTRRDKHRKLAKKRENLGKNDAADGDENKRGKKRTERKEDGRRSGKRGKRTERMGIERKDRRSWRGEEEEDEGTSGSSLNVSSEERDWSQASSVSERIAYGRRRRGTAKD